MCAPVVCAYCSLPMSAGRGRSKPARCTEPVYCCYGCSLAARIAMDRGETGRTVSPFTRLGVSVFLSMGVMVFSLALYSRDIYGVDHTTASPLASSLFGLIRYLLLVMATPVFLLLGVPILTNAWRSLRAGIVSIDALIVLGVAAAYVSSYVSTLTDRGGVYYETACMILVLVTLGRYLEASGKLKASAAVEALARLIPDEVCVRRGSSVQTLALAEISVGDLLMVPAGGRVAVDGVIESGQAQIDERIVTGESTPIPKVAGDAVLAGSVAVDGAVTVRATSVGAESTVGRMATLLEEAMRAKGRYERLADRLATAFVPGMIAFALLGALLGYRRGSTDEAIMTGLAVLLISCPCALGIATPMAAWISLGQAATLGILFRDGDALEALARIRTIGFDKTGTLTTGRPVVSSFVAASSDGAASQGILSLAAGLEMGSTHSFAQGILAYAIHCGAPPEHRIDSRTIPGRGLIADVDGVTVRLGSVALMEEASVGFNDEMRSQVDRAMAADQPICCLSRDRTVVGVFAFSERLRAEAGGVLRSLERHGYHLEILTGDHRRRGDAVAKELGVLTNSALTPADKIVHIERMRRAVGPVAMVGDGLNDAPALAAADVGIAMGCGTDLTRAAASVCLLGDDLTALPEALTVARQTVRVIKLNLFWAFFYNLIGVGLALSGRLSPIFAACAMVVSSLFVLTNSLRLGGSSSDSAAASARAAANPVTA